MITKNAQQMTAALNTQMSFRSQDMAVEMQECLATCTAVTRRLAESCDAWDSLFDSACERENAIKRQQQDASEYQTLARFLGLIEG